MAKPLRVGIIGASAAGGWARDSHVPAVTRLDGLELVAVGASHQPSADAAARAFGAKAAYGDGLDLIGDPDVDLVAVCVKVPDHRGLVLAAVAAGKHVYCEWPLGRDLAESQELADAAEVAGVRTAIGLQTRANPAARAARQAVASGAIGRPLCARVYSTTAAFGPDVPASMAYAEDADNGVTLVTIQGAHTIDLAVALLGPFADATALTTTQYPHVRVGGHAQPRTTADHVLIQARLAGGVPLSIEVVGGRPADATPFRLELTGDRGDLVLTGGAARGVQSGTLTLSVNGTLQTIDPGEATSLPAAAVNVAGLYAAFRDDIVNGTSTVADFRHAVRLNRLVDDLTASSAAGVRKQAGDWPRA